MAVLSAVVGGLGFAFACADKETANKIRVHRWGVYTLSPEHIRGEKIWLRHAGGVFQPALVDTNHHTLHSTAALFKIP